MFSRARARQLRLGRHSQTEQIYLITAVTHGRDPVFSDWRVGRLLVSQLRKAQQNGLADSLAWVVMPDHFHWLMQLKHGDLSDVVHTVKSRTAREANEFLGRSGRFWQRGFHDRAIRQEEDVKPTARYIVANPIRAGLVTRVHDYPLWDVCWL